MKKRLAAALLVLVLLSLSGCGFLKVYNLDEILPPLIDITTQYPYTEKITVTNCLTGEALEFTEGKDHDLIRMRLEGIQAIREKAKASDDQPLFEITFTTTDGIFSVKILENGYHLVIDGYNYETLGSAVDLLYFENLFA